MLRVSNGLVGIVNILTALISLPIIGTGLLFGLKSASECEKFLQSPFFIFGVFLLVVSLVGLLGSCCRSSLLMWVYLFVMLALILALAAFTAFAFVVTNKGAGEAVSGKGYKEYRLGEYSEWLQRVVGEKGNWERIESCLRAAGVCRGFQSGYLLTATEFYQTNLSPTQSGCCKPPTQCGYIYKNATYWTVPKTGHTSSQSEPDCLEWSNDQEKLCYSCDSCKAGFLANIKTQWKKLAIVNISLLVFLVVVYSIGCCALRNNRSGRYTRYNGYR